MRFEEIIALHPQPTEVDRETLLRCVRECLDCGASCTACADASLAEADVEEMIRCIRLCLDCADACDATGRIVVRQTEPDATVLRGTIVACAAACEACAEECERHAAHHEHCRVCVEECRECKAACDDLLAAMA
jgi:hypothetical protein